MVSEAAKKKAVARKAAAAAAHGGTKKTAAGIDAHEELATESREDARRWETFTQLTLPCTLTPRLRALIHQAADDAGLPHHSIGEGPARRIVLGGPPAGAEPSGASPIPPSTDAAPAAYELRYDAALEMSDESLADELLRWLGLDIAAQLLAAADGTPGDGHHGFPGGPGGAAARAAARMTQDAFVAEQAPLVDAERNAEVAASAGEHAAGPSAAAAARRGRVLSGLKCVAAAGGLLGRTLLTLERPRGEGAGGGGHLADVLFGRRPPRLPPRPSPPPPSWFDPTLDLSQRSVVAAVLSTPDVALVHGPPGTGKTTAVVEIIRQLVAGGHRVLACAASNTAVDTLTERLARSAPGLALLRLGHPARLHPTVLAASLDAQVLHADASGLANDIRREIRDGTAKLVKLAAGGYKDRDERRALQRELRRLAGEERTRQGAAVKEVVARSAVVCCTLSGASSHQLAVPGAGSAPGKLPFDVVVIDEAAQATEAACWAALLRAPRCVLAGDHLQLPPTVICPAAEPALGRTLFARAHAAHPDTATMLTVQYRMHAAICAWPSKELYGGRLRPHPRVASHLLQGMAGVSPAGSDASDAARLCCPLVAIETAGCCGMEEADDPDGSGSKLNPGEARAALAWVARLVAAGVPPKCIGVISGYSAQVALLRSLRPESMPELEISTVDGFQGREKEAIVISCVRSSAGGGVGFLADARRMNVAITRARRQLAVVGDSETLARAPFLARMWAYLGEHGEVLSADEVLPQ